jgi:tetratricopeptide (TPR) repeat protein
VIITCPHCGKRHKLPEDWSANKVRCSRCGEKFFLDELASEFITLDKPQKENIAASSSGDVPRASRAIPHLRLAIGIAAVLVIAGTTAFYFLHVVPENKFRQAMREGQEAEKAERWDEAENAYYRAALLRRNNSTVEESQLRVLEKRRLAEYAEAMTRGKAVEQLNNWEAALREYQTALMRKADDAEAKACIARVQYQLHMKEGREAEQQKRWDMALIAYSHALSVNRGDTDAIEAEQRVRKLRAESDAKKVAFQETPKVTAPKIESAPTEKTKPSEPIKLTWNATDSSSAISDLPKQTVRPQETGEWIKQYLLKKNGAEVSVTWNPNSPLDPNGVRAAQQISDTLKQLDPKSPEAQTALNRLLTEQLILSEHLLAQSDPQRRQEGLAITVHAMRAAVGKLQDKELAVAIADLALANRDAADSRSWKWLNPQMVIERAATVYKDAGDTERLRNAYELLIRHATDAGNNNAADSARYWLAESYLKNGDRETARKYADAISPESDIAGAKRVAVNRIENNAPQRPAVGRNPILKQLLEKQGGK